MKLTGALVVAALILAASACRKPLPDFPDFGFVPPFSLTSQNGQAFDSKVLDGKIWAADFFFTSCNGPCPRMTSQMHQVQQEVWRMAEVRLVSFTVDPARDTPEQLTAYAKAHHASPERWYFLTGPQETLNHLGLDVFKLTRVDGTLQHSTRFVLVDRKSHIRGYYDTSEKGAISKLVDDIHALGRLQG